MENLSYQIKSELPPSKDCHRHMLCLYGDDEKFLRLRAMELGVSVSQFIRIAIALYIRHFEFNERIYRFWSNKFLIAQFYKIYGQDEIPFEQRQNSLKKMVKEQTGTVHKRILSPAKVFWYGIKFCKSVSCDFVKNSSLPLQHIFTFTRYAETDWFRIYYPPPSDYPFEGFSIAA